MQRNVSNAGTCRIGHAADRLIAAIESKRAPVCVGIDPVVARLPKSVLHLADETAAELGRGRVSKSERVISSERDCVAVTTFVMDLLEHVADVVPCVKFQSACFERLRGGMDELARCIESARDLGLEVILDAKRGDIGLTAEHYAVAAFGDSSASEDHDAADWLTINSYLGRDGIEPFLRPGKGAFALVRTSNPGGDEIQGAILRDGRTVAEHVGSVISEIGDATIGERGYSSLGAVVGATKPADAAKLRAIMPRQMFLVPGYGSQGGGVDEVMPCFDANGCGAIVTASRSVIYAFEKDDPEWEASVREAAESFADEVGRAVGMR